MAAYREHETYQWQQSMAEWPFTGCESLLIDVGASLSLTNAER